MTILRTHHHDGTLAAVATTANTGYDNITGTAPVYVTGGFNNQALRWTSDASASYLQDNLTGEYVSFDVKFSSLPTANMAIAVCTNAAGTALGAIVINTAGHIVIYSGLTTVVATSTATLSTGVWHRIEWHAGSGSQELRYYDTASSGTVTETLVGAAGAVSFERIRVGLPWAANKGNTGNTVDIDEVNIADDWPNVVSAPPTVSLTGNQNLAAGVTANIVVSAASSSGSIAAYNFVVDYCSTTPPTLTGATTSAASFTTPAAGNLVVIKVVVTDNVGQTATAYTEVRVPVAAGTAIRPLPGTSSWVYGVAGTFTNTGGATTSPEALSDELDTTYLESASVSSTEQTIRTRMQPSVPKSSLTVSSKILTDTGTASAVVRLYEGGTNSINSGTSRALGSNTATATTTAASINATLTTPAALIDWGAIWVETGGTT